MEPKVIIFQTGGTLIAKLEEAPSADLGEPDCILVQPFNIMPDGTLQNWLGDICLLYTSPSPRDATLSRMPSSA